MNTGLLSITLLVAAVEGGAPPAGEPPRVAAVRIGWGCIEVPTSYRVVETPTEIIDQHYGFISAPDRPSVEWSFGMSESHPLCHQTCKILSQREEILGGSTWSLGVLKEGEKKASFIMGQLISFRTNSDGPLAQAHLRDLASRYHRRDRTEECLPPKAP